MAKGMIPNVYVDILRSRRDIKCCQDNVPNSYVFCMHALRCAIYMFTLGPKLGHRRLREELEAQGIDCKGVSHFEQVY